ncbi:MAG: hypothetical protein FWF46_03420 [Oscillospiraceae bacterium]|nr:hypothetical protein [Oscillospiraceae bacterium]
MKEELSKKRKVEIAGRLKETRDNMRMTKSEFAKLIRAFQSILYYSGKRG